MAKRSNKKADYSFLGFDIPVKYLLHPGYTAAVAANEDAMTDDPADEIMERIVRSATQNSDRAQLRERRRSRANRKSSMLEFTFHPTTIYTRFTQFTLCNTSV